MPQADDASEARRNLIVMLLLTFSTGVADAVGFLGLDKIFTGNMTGNVVIMGMAAAGQANLPVLGPTVALVAFMVGAVLGGRFVSSSDAGWNQRVTVTMAVLAAGLWVLVGVTLLLPISGGEPGGVAVAAGVAVVMGAQAAAARHVGVKDVTTVVVTSTITALAADSRLAGRSGAFWTRRLWAVVLIGSGALAGALLLRVGLWSGLALSASIVTVVAVVQGVHHRRRRTEAPLRPWGRLRGDRPVVR